MQAQSEISKSKFAPVGATGLKTLKITAPERVRVGDSALLTCSYDLENAPLYVIKWYLDDTEFYRYVPKKEPSHAIFPVRDIQVNVSVNSVIRDKEEDVKTFIEPVNHRRLENIELIDIFPVFLDGVSGSNSQDVTLVHMTRNHTGHYSCEVTEDGPTYDTRAQEAHVLVVDVPETEPRIAVDKEHLPAGETLRANCTSGASRPAPNITWTLNGAPIWYLRVYLGSSTTEKQKCTLGADKFKQKSITRRGKKKIFLDKNEAARKKNKESVQSQRQ
ncbi:hypothetical protein TSAR_010661 [Trichomalopsis sarcophagae]|uniref:Ig-like domain-containing protein n=1 Tax=Trichomalopsis sarcophagae TaxID=543379 RepID=A0A232FMF5_9HYME|nr:hypothetical protein TSAR_010661 [Trichomalopsis sarcophagae]